MVFGAFAGVFQVYFQVTTGSLQVVKELVFDADAFAEYLFRCEAAFCYRRECLVIVGDGHRYFRRDMRSHTVVGDTAECYLLYVRFFSQVYREAGIRIVPAAPFEIRLFVAATESVCQAVGLSVAVRYRACGRFVPVQR